jgi:putative acetyltransferase
MTDLVPLDRERDAEAVLQVFQSASDYVLLESGSLPTMENVQEFFKDAPPGQAPDAVLKLGIVGAGKLVGVADLAFGYPSSEDAYIGLMLIDNAERGKGFGRAALAQLERLAKERKTTRLLLAVLEENALAINFWERRGFSLELRTTRAFIGKKMHVCLRYVKELSQVNVSIRKYRPQDLDGVIDVFIRAIREIASKDYSPAQVAAWAQADRQLWSQRRTSRPTWVADVDGKPVGFIDLESDGHIDMMYVDPDYLGQGVAKQLLQTVETEARASSLKRLYSEVSLTARSFFERNGFHVVEPETVFRNGEYFDRFKMAKELR